MLRGAIGQVQQDVFIFTGDIKSNISLNNEAISPDDVRRAAEIVNADPFIQKLPHGYDEPVTYERDADTMTIHAPFVQSDMPVVYRMKLK